MTVTADEVAARRAEWRAELCRYNHALLSADIDKVSAPIAASLTQQATDAENMAALYDLEAEVIRGIAQAKANYRSGEIDRDSYKRTLEEWESQRRYWRDIGAFHGMAVAAVMNNFSEPSDDELAAQED